MDFLDCLLGIWSDQINVTEVLEERRGGECERMMVNGFAIFVTMLPIHSTI